MGESGYDRAWPIVTSNKQFGRWGEVFADDVSSQEAAFAPGQLRSKRSSYPSRPGAPGIRQSTARRDIATAGARRIFANTIKYVLMGTSSNFGNMFSAASASPVLSFLPMLPSQILLNTPRRVFHASPALSGRAGSLSRSPPRPW
jgi:hypothetical protein